MKDISIANTLKELGFSKPETDVYLTLLGLGGTDATNISKETGIKRTTVYPILERLMSNGAVTCLDQGKKRLYTPIQPNHLPSLFEKKLRSLTEIIPLLESLQGKHVKEYGIRLVQTKKEFEAFYSRILDEYRGREYYIIGSSPEFLNVDREFLLDFRKKRAAGKTRVKLLLSHDSRQEVGQNDPSLLREFKYLPEKYFFKSTIDIYDDKIVIVGPSVKALAVVIAVPPMVDVFKSVFEILWEALPVNRT